MAVNKKFLAFSAAGVLTVATSVPALAFENEFHGMFQLQYDNSNFNGSTKLDANGMFYQPEGTGKEAPTANFFEQRARLAYIGKANDNLKLVTKFEIDYAYWGNSSYGVQRNGGGAIGADEVNFETKNVYLDLNIPGTKVNAKLGMQPIDDAFKGVFVSADMAGLLFSHVYDKATTSAGFFRWNDNQTDTLGKNTRDFFMIDGKYAVSDTLKVGGAYYLVNSDNVPTEDLIVHMLGVNAEAGFGPVTVDGFAIYQFGNNDRTAQHISAFAANVGTKVKVGKGTARAEFLYASGEGDTTRGTSNAFIAETTGESGFYSNEMVILGRDKYAMTYDSAIVFDANNKNQGVIFGSLGYDHPVTDKVNASVNLGFAAVAKENQNKPLNLQTGRVNNSNYLGTEVNAEVGYKLFENATLIARGGYVVLGDYYKDVATNGTPDNPYDIKLIVNYSF